MPDHVQGRVTELLVDWSQGNEQALERLMPLVYDELHRLAERYLRRERADHTLQTTALVHEAYLRLVDQRRVEWRGTLHFLALAAKMMRRILADHARSHRYLKRGGNLRKVQLEQAGQLAIERDPDLAALDEALDRLADADPELAKLVEMRFFGGMKSEEIGELLGISVPTVGRRWLLAKAWLYRYLTASGDGDET